MSRLSEEMDRDCGRMSGYQFIEVITISKWFLTDRLRTRSLALPTDPPDRAQRIVQFVETRMVLSIPQLVRGSCPVVLVGKGIDQSRQVLAAVTLAECRGPLVVALPSETPHAPAHCPRPFPVGVCMIFTAPYVNRDCVFLSSLIETWAPKVAVCDSHPLKPLPDKLEKLSSVGRTAWNWEINTASLGIPTGSHVACLCFWQGYRSGML